MLYVVNHFPEDIQKKRFLIGLFWLTSQFFHLLVCKHFQDLGIMAVCYRELRVIAASWQDVLVVSSRVSGSPVVGCPGQQLQQREQ